MDTKKHNNLFLRRVSGTKKIRMSERSVLNLSQLTERDMKALLFGFERFRPPIRDLGVQTMDAIFNINFKYPFKEMKITESGMILT